MCYLAGGGQYYNSIIAVYMYVGIKCICTYLGQGLEWSDDFRMLDLDVW